MIIWNDWEDLPLNSICYNSFCESAATERRSKKTHGFHRCTRSLWHGFFWPLFFSIHRDFKRICKRCRLRLLLLRPSNILSLIEQVPHTCKIRLIRSISVRKNIRVWIILSWPRISRIPRIYTMSNLKRFVRFVFEKNIRVWIILSWPRIYRIKRII